MIAILQRTKLLTYVVVLALVSPVIGQQGGSAGTFSTEQLEQIAAPVALYPDPLLAQVLMASTYPLEVVQAARFLREHKDLKGPQLDEALKDQTWDDSVKSLVSFPEVLSLMDGKLDWTQKLGDATIGQQKELMEAIQRLRARAQAEGNLKSSKEQTVTVEPAPAAAPGQAVPAQTIVIQPTNPDVVYVPAYNPTVVYGAWPYPAYPPAYPYPPGYAFGGALLSFGIGMAVGGALWGNCNWGGGNVDVNVNRNANFSKNVNRSNVSNERVNNYRQGGRAAIARSGTTTRSIARACSTAIRRRSRSTTAGRTPRRSSRVRIFEAAPSRAGRTSREMPAGSGMPAGSEVVVGSGDAGGQRGGGGQGYGGGGGRGGAGAFQGVGGGSGGGGNVRADSSRGQSSRQSMGASSASRGGGGAAASRPSGGGGASRGGGGGSRGGGGGRR